MFFITDAYAQTAGEMPGGALMQFMPFILMFVLLYFLMIRPQMKRAKEQKAMLASIQKGHEVATIGGIVGKVTKVDDNFITVDIARTGSTPTEVVFQRNAVQAILPTGSLK